jgi:ACT domain-containing protein
MIIREKETYLTATEAAKHLGIARGTFYRQYKDSLQEYTVGKRKRIYYRLAQIEEINSVEPVSNVVEQPSSVVESVPNPPRPFTLLP